MIPQQLIWFWCGQVIAVADSTLEFFFGKQCPKCHQFIANLVKDFNINVSVKYSIECGVESIPKIVKSKTWLIIILDSLNSGQFAFVNPAHKLLRASTLVSYLLNLNVEKKSFGDFDKFLE